jgi:hypothetical protein
MVSKVFEFEGVLNVGEAARVIDQVEGMMAEDGRPGVGICVLLVRTTGGRHNRRDDRIVCYW